MKGIALLFLSVLAFCGPVDLGTHGKTYEPAEPDFFELIKSPEVQKRIASATAGAKHSLGNSFSGKASVEGCVATGTREYEPTYTLKNEIRSADGKMLFPKGYRFNILGRLAAKGAVFRRRILFIDADDPVHVALAKRYADGADIIVARGDGMPLAREGVRVAVANPVIVDRFGLKCLPSMYEQRGDRFFIREYTDKYLLAQGVGR